MRPSSSTILPIRFATGVLLLLGGLSPANPLSGKTLSELPAARRAAVEKKIANQREAFEAFKNGDSTRGFEAIQRNISRHPRSPDPFLQEARSLVVVATMLSNAGERSQARAVASLALSRILPAAQNRMRAEDRIAALNLAADIWDHQLLEPAQAISAYRAALAVDPQNKSAADRLAFLEAREARQLVAKHGGK